MSRISYEDKKGGEVAVYLDGRKIGMIARNRDGSWYYKPKIGDLMGEAQLSVAAVKRWIETEKQWMDAVSRNA